ncbi:MAG: type IIL restriction-modification enzyme MmeI [Campylobacterales bacterium]
MFAEDWRGRYRYSVGIVYNNFPFPLEASDKQKSDIERLAQAVLDARAEFPDSSLADLYNPLTMPPRLLKAHEALDRAVDKLYRKDGFKSDTERVAHLFELNQKLTSLVIDEPKKRGKR